MYRRERSPCPFKQKWVPQYFIVAGYTGDRNRVEPWETVAQEERGKGAVGRGQFGRRSEYLPVGEEGEGLE